MHSRGPVAGTWDLLARGSGGTDGPRFPVSRLRRIVRVAKGGRVLLRPQTATRTCIIVRTITLQLAWTPLKGLISCKRIEVSDIVKTVSGLLLGATFSRSLCLASLHPAPPHPVTTCVVCGISWQLEHRLLQQLHGPLVLREQKTTEAGY